MQFPALPRQLTHARRWLAPLLGALAALLAALGMGGWRLYTAGRALQNDLIALAALAARPDAQSLAAAGPLLAQSRSHAARLRDEAGPWLWLAPRLGWVPTYGPTIAAAEPLLDAAVGLTRAADESYTALAPLLTRADSTRPIGQRAAQQLVAAAPNLRAARDDLSRGQSALAAVPHDGILPALRDPLRRLLPLLPDAQDGLDATIAGPGLLGADGPRSYLLLIQDPRELRATGGFIGAVGRLELDRGRVSALSIGDVVAIDDWRNKVYPDPPAPLRRYMAIEQWFFRDANWSPDFPTAARAAMELYQLGQGGSIDGVIAVEPGLLPALLGATGPIEVEGEEVAAANVLAYIDRQYALNFPAGRKDFLGPLAAAIGARLAAGSPAVDPLKLAGALRAALDRRALQVYVEQPDAAALLARRGWDGALRPGPADYLFVVDSNLGYNKVNASIDEGIEYSVDLSDPRAPLATLTVRQRNRLPGQGQCRPFGAKEHTVQRLVTGCYWDYMRVLAPRGSELLSATARPIPAEAMADGQAEPGATSVSDENRGVSTFATMLLVPYESEVATQYVYRLPPGVLVADAGGWRYRLTVQRQAGTSARPLTVRVRLPARAALLSASLALQCQSDASLVSKLSLTRDQFIEMSFKIAQ